MAPPELLARLIALFPDFASHWDDAGNCFRDDDGSFTLHGAFTEFSTYFRDNYEQFSKDRLSALADFLDECMTEPDSVLDNAAATCFLENVSCERFSKEFEGYLRGEPLKFYAYWNNPG
jgi:hypothetical protein